MKKYVIIVLAFIPFATVVNAQQIVRGPYLQKPTSSSMVVKWRTDAPADSRVYYGTDMNNLTQYEEVAASATDHEVEITGLQPFTKYYYAVGTSTQMLAPASTQRHFKTAPIPGTIQPIRIWATGDFGKGNKGQADTRDSYISFTGNKHTDVWLWLGDNAYDDGTDEEYQTKVFRGANTYEPLFSYMPFMPVPGNHDYNSVCAIPCNKNPEDHSGPYLDIISVPENGEAGGVPSGTKLYYSYDYGNVHFIAFNSELGSLNAGWDYIGAYGSSNANNSPLMNWLKADLAANDKMFTVVYFHQPPYSKGSHDSDNFWEIYMKAIRENYLPVFEQYGVDIVLSGHSHNYERSYLINGHYSSNSSSFNQSNIINGSCGNASLGDAYEKYSEGSNANKGTIYVVCGNAGSSRGSVPANMHPAMCFRDFGSNVFGSFIMDVSGNVLEGKYLTSEGVIKDKFTLRKTTAVSTKDRAFLNNILDLQITPNPFSNRAQINFTLDRTAPLQIQLVDMEGKINHTLYNQIADAGNHTLNVDAAALNLSNGIYIVRLSDGKNTAFDRILKLE